MGIHKQPKPAMHSQFDASPRLPSQPQTVTAHWPVPYYNRSMHVNKLLLHSQYATSWWPSPTSPSRHPWHDARRLSNTSARGRKIRPRHQGGAHGGRAPAKLVRAPAKITGLIMFHLGCQIEILVFLGIFGIKKSKKTKWQPCISWRLD